MGIELLKAPIDRNYSMIAAALNSTMAFLAGTLNNPLESYSVSVKLNYFRVRAKPNISFD